MYVPPPSPTPDSDPYYVAPTSVGTHVFEMNFLGVVIMLVLAFGVVLPLLRWWHSGRHPCICTHRPHGMHTLAAEGACWHCKCRCYIPS